MSGAGNTFGFVDTNGFAVGTVDTVTGLTTNNGTTQLPAPPATSTSIKRSTSGRLTWTPSCGRHDHSKWTGTITADGLGIRAQNNVSLTLANDVNTIAANITGAGNSFTYTDATGVTIGSIPAIGAIAAIDGVTHQ